MILRLAGLAAAWAALVAADTAPLDIVAERLDLDHKAGVARFEGAVVARQEGFELRCARLVARYDEAGRLASLVAEGEVTLRGEGLGATAAQATYDRAEGVLVLTGTPEVRRGGDRITGERIRLWPGDGRLVVDKARGNLVAPRLGRLVAPEARR